MTFSLSETANLKLNIIEVSIMEQTIVEEILVPVGDNYAYPLMPKESKVGVVNPHNYITTSIDAEVGINSRKWTFKAGEPGYVEPEYFAQVYRSLETAGKL